VSDAHEGENQQQQLSIREPYIVQFLEEKEKAEGEKSGESWRVLERSAGRYRKLIGGVC